MFSSVFDFVFVLDVVLLADHIFFPLNEVTHFSFDGGFSIFVFVDEAGTCSLSCFKLKLGFYYNKYI